MGCCATDHVQSKTDLFISRIIGSTLLSHKDFRDLLNEIEYHFNQSTEMNIIEAYNFMSQNFYHKNSKDDEKSYHELLFKNLLKLIFKTEKGKTLKEENNPEVQSIYWLIFLVFPLIREKVSDNKIDVKEKLRRLYHIIALIVDKEEINSADLKNKIPIYLKGLLLVIFRSIYTESKNHILSVELTKDLEVKNKTIFTENNVNSFINEHFLNKNLNVPDEKLIKETEIHEYLFNEIVFFNDLYMMFIDYVSSIKKE